MVLRTSAYVFQTIIQIHITSFLKGKNTTLIIYSNEIYFIKLQNMGLFNFKIKINTMNINYNYSHFEIDKSHLDVVKL